MDFSLGNMLETITFMGCARGLGLGSNTCKIKFTKIMLHTKQWRSKNFGSRGIQFNII